MSRDGKLIYSSGRNHTAVTEIIGAGNILINCAVLSDMRVNLVHEVIAANPKSDPSTKFRSKCHTAHRFQATPTDKILRFKENSHGHTFRGMGGRPYASNDVIQRIDLSHGGLVYHRMLAGYVLSALLLT